MLTGTGVTGVTGAGHGSAAGELFVCAVSALPAFKVPVGSSGAAAAAALSISAEGVHAEAADAVSVLQPAM